MGAVTDDGALRIVIPESDTDDFQSVTGTLIETASVLPNTRQVIDGEGTRIITIARGDTQRYPEIGEKIRRLTHRYEQLVEHRDELERQLDDTDWDEYHDLD